MFFVDARTGQGSVAYHRDDGHYGLITSAGRRPGATVDASMHARMAWHYPPSYAWAPRCLTRSTWRATPAGCSSRPSRRSSPDWDVVVGSEVLQGAAGLVLVRAAGDAELLVVGSRGHGALTGMLLGSVSEHCVHPAPARSWSSATMTGN